VITETPTDDGRRPLALVSVWLFRRGTWKTQRV
jgi:hypothetical protein